MRSPGSALARGAFYFGAKHRIDDGRIINDMNTEYFIRAASSHGYDYWGVQLLPVLRPRPLAGFVAGGKEEVR